ncbi:MAG: copper chaperone PCu(A)C [Gammaproteobacteria bacterium]|nr:copper chaperone PCu(A)C [Gammaproteobacteria bacterium]
MRSIISVLILFGVLCSVASARSLALEVTNAWVREAPPNAKALAGYVKLKNVSDRSLVLSQISSRSFEQVEFHATVLEGGMMRMKHLEKIELAPGEVIEFEPGGKHLMLKKPRKHLRDGDSVQLSITDVDGGTLMFEMQVRR